VLYTRVTNLIMSLRFFLSSSGILEKTSNPAKFEVISGCNIK